MKKRHKDLDYKDFDMNDEVVQKKNKRKSLDNDDLVINDKAAQKEKKKGNVEHIIMQQISEDQTDAITLNNVKSKRNLKEKYCEKNNLNLEDDVSLVKVNEELEYVNELSQDILETSKSKAKKYKRHKKNSNVISFSCDDESGGKEIETIGVKLSTIFNVKNKDVDFENNIFDMNDTVVQKKKKKHKRKDSDNNF
ncbi:hypothetical protein NPIL_598251, partial [Nephila pilipes]